MIKNLLNKIKSFFKKEKVQNATHKNNCPDKIERPIEPKETIEIMTCEHCKKELQGKESAKDTDGSAYIWCNNCNYVNKVKNGKVIRKENNGEEVMKAFKLFKQAGITASKYATEENGVKKSFK